MNKALALAILVLAALGLRELLRALSTAERVEPLPNVDWTGW